MVKKGSTFDVCKNYSYRIDWCGEDQEFVATCDQFPYLSWLGDNPISAFSGILRSVVEVVADMDDLNLKNS